MVLGKVFYGANVVHFCKIREVNARFLPYFFALRKNCEPGIGTLTAFVNVLHFSDRQLFMCWVYNVVKKNPTCKLADEDKAKKC